MFAAPDTSIIIVLLAKYESNDGEKLQAVPLGTKSSVKYSATQDMRKPTTCCRRWVSLCTGYGVKDGGRGGEKTIPCCRHPCCT